MQIIIAGRHFTVSESLKADINGRLEAILNSVHLNISTVRVILDIEHTNRCTAEVIVSLKNSVIEADAWRADSREGELRVRSGGAHTWSLGHGGVDLHHRTSHR